MSELVLVLIAETMYRVPTWRILDTRQDDASFANMLRSVACMTVASAYLRKCYAYIHTESARDAKNETMRRYEVASRIYQLRDTRCTSAYTSADLNRQPLLVCIFYLARVYMQHEQSCLETGARAYDSICA